jgi:hypothetical protein
VKQQPKKVVREVSSLGGLPENPHHALDKETQADVAKGSRVVETTDTGSMRVPSSLKVKEVAPNSIPANADTGYVVAQTVTTDNFKVSPNLRGSTAANDMMSVVSSSTATVPK